MARWTTSDPKRSSKSVDRTEANVNCGKIVLLGYIYTIVPAPAILGEW